MVVTNVFRISLVTPSLLIGLIYFLTFFVILPLVCRDLPYSAYFVESVPDQLRSATEQHQRRVDQDTDYFMKTPREIRTSYLDRLVNGTNDVIVAVVTSERSVADIGGGYVTQVMAAFDRMFRSAANFRRPAIFLCNTDGRSNGHQEALWLAGYFPMVQRSADRRSSTTGVQNPEKQRQDYAFCLNAALSYRSRYVMVVEDDAVPNPDLFTVLEHILDQRIARKWRGGELRDNPDRWAYVKLYYPDRWRSYGSDVRTTLEVAAVGSLGGAATWWCLFAFRRSCLRPNAGLIFGVASVYFGLICVLIGRPYTQRWRRILPDLYTVVASPECCIPAVLYPRPVLGDLVAHLENITWRTDPVDIVIDRYFSARSYSRYLIEPNLFKHRGFYSSMKGQSMHPAMFLD